MGTEFKLYEDDKFGELTINEMSNELSLCFIKLDKNWQFNSNDMSPKEMAEVFLKGLTVCSYWIDTDVLKEMIHQYVEKELY